jgi:hypothetical protein
MLPRCAPIATALLVCFFAGSGRAQTPEAAARHFERAITHADEKQFDQAIVEFQKAYEVQPHYSVQYNLGLAYAGAGNPSRALGAFELYLSGGGAAVPRERRERVEELMRGLRAKVGRVRLRVDPPGATVHVDGAPFSPDPSGNWFDPGEHKVLLRAKDHAERALLVTVRTNETVEVNAMLARLPARSLSLVCPVPDVSVQVDGRQLAVTSGYAGIWRTVVPPDARTLVFHRVGYADHAMTLDDAAVDRPLACVLRPVQQHATARLDVRTSEAGALTTVDGLPFRGLPLVPGKHIVSVRRPGFEPFRRVVVLEAWRTLSLFATLSPTAAYRFEYERRASRRRTQAYFVAGAGLTLAALSVATLVYSNELYDDWEAEQAKLPADPSARAPEQHRAQAENDERKSEIQTLDRVAFSLGIGSALTFGAAVWLYVGGDDPRRYRGRAKRPVGSAIAIAGNAVIFRHAF